MLKTMHNLLRRLLFASQVADEALIKVYDLDGNLRDFEYVKRKYGVAYRRAEVAPGQKVYRLVELWEKTGHHSLITQVLDEDGNPVDRQDVAFYWSDAPDPPDPPTEVYAHDWYRNFVHGLTNIFGDVGPAMGRGAYHGEGEGGPHAVWVRDPNIPSDICEKLGMLAGTFHDHLDQKFRRERQGEEPDPIEGKFVEVESKRRFDRTEGTNHIALNCEETSTRDFFDTAVDLRVGEDWRNPDWVDPNPHPPKSLYHYNIPADYIPGPGEEERTFWAILRHAGTEEILGNPMAFEHQTGIHGIHHAYVIWQTEEAPPPPPNGLAALFQQLSAAHMEIAGIYEEIVDVLRELKQM